MKNMQLTLTMTKTKEAYEQEGKAGEIAFRKWLDVEQVGYLYIDQTLEFFSHTFKKDIKRPDFLLLIPKVGFMAVDVKHHKTGTYDDKTCFTLNIDKELNRAVGFEDLSKTSLWYAYKNKDDGKDESWYFIDATTAITKGIVYKNNKKNDEYLSIDIKEFKKITTSKDISNSLLSLNFDSKNTSLKKLVDTFHSDRTRLELLTKLEA